MFRNISLVYSCPLIFFGIVCVSERIEYISTEHPKVTYFNPKYMNFLNFTCQRYGRSDPFYYVGLHIYTLQPWHNNVTCDFYFYEWLTNVYKPTFVEMHFKFCDLIHKDKFFGLAMKQGKLARPCPYPPGAYNLYNMTVPLKSIPRNFPFRKGRIYVNFTATDNKELIGSGQINMEIKHYNTRTKKIY